LRARPLATAQKPPSREAQHRDVEPRLAVGRRHDLETAPSNPRSRRGADPHRPAPSRVGTGRQRRAGWPSTASKRPSWAARARRRPRAPTARRWHPRRRRRGVARRPVDVPGAVRVAAAPDHPAVIDDEDRLAAARSAGRLRNRGSRLSLRWKTAPHQVSEPS
jgi:hypothetical protein